MITYRVGGGVLPNRCGHCGRILLERIRFCDTFCAGEATGGRLPWWRVLTDRLRRAAPAR